MLEQFLQWSFKLCARPSGVVLEQPVNDGSRLSGVVLEQPRLDHQSGWSMSLPGGLPREAPLAGLSFPESKGAES